ITGEQLTWIKQERSMSTENSMVMIKLLIQFIKCIIKRKQIYTYITVKHLDHYRLLLIFFSDIIVNTTLIVDSDSAKQTETAIENLKKEITAQEILLPQRHRGLEQDSNKLIEQFFFVLNDDMNTTCYGDSTKDHSGPAACQGM
ncbi:unnamed protein product, partial [Rotaria magnacalcarata]